MQKIIHEANLKQIVSRSLLLETELLRFADFNNVGPSIREMTTGTICSICFEHARSLRILMNAGNFTSAIGVLRLQYEALVRAMWVYYAASDELTLKLSEELTPENIKSASRLPMLSDMLSQVEKKAPKQVYEKLDEIKNTTWKSMNSFTHSGIHAINRHKKGYPVTLVHQIIKHSNGMSSIAAILFYDLTNETRIGAVLDKVSSEFDDCLPLNRPS